MTAAENDLAYTTVLSLLQVMEQKGLVGHKRVGKAYAYFAKVRREPTVRKLAGGFLDKVFDGAVDEYLVHVLGSRKLKEAELARLDAMIAEARKRTRPRARKGPKHDALDRSDRPVAGRLLPGGNDPPCAGRRRLVLDQTAGMADGCRLGHARQLAGGCRLLSLGVAPAHRSARTLRSGGTVRCPSRDKRTTSPRTGGFRDSVRARAARSPTANRSAAPSQSGAAGRRCFPA